MISARRVAAAPVLLVAYVGAVGAYESFAGLPPSAAGSGVFLALFAVALVLAAYFLLRPDIRSLRDTPRERIRLSVRTASA